MLFQIRGHPHNPLPVGWGNGLHLIELGFGTGSLPPAQMAFAPFGLQNFARLGDAEPLRGRFVSFEFIILSHRCLSVSSYRFQVPSFRLVVRHNKTRGLKVVKPLAYGWFPFGLMV